MSSIGSTSRGMKRSQTEQTSEAKRTKLLEQTTSEETTKCYLLELPAEIRNYIMELVVTQHPSSSDAYEVNIAPNNSQGFEQPAISRTCQQLRAEALPVFYGKIVFDLDELDAAGHWNNCVDWLEAVEDHVHLIRDARMLFCETHYTNLYIESYLLSEGYRVRYDLDTASRWDWICCEVTKKWRKVEPVMRDISNAAGENGLTARDFIHVGDLMARARGRGCCWFNATPSSSEDERDSKDGNDLNEEDEFNEEHELSEEDDSSEEDELSEEDGSGEENK